MDVANALGPLEEAPEDARSAHEMAGADEVLYRMGLRCTPVPGLPDELKIGDVGVTFTRGPVRTQRTWLRQRHTFPPVFDKHMERPAIGAAEVIAIFTIGPEPPPADYEQQFASWRAHALAAAGVLTAVLDERIAGEELFEDAVLFRDGRAIGGADRRSRVRSYLPFDLHAGDRAVLESLGSLQLTEQSAAARAARLYRRAALEGPTADAYALLWMAAECFSPHRSPSRKDIEAVLRDEGVDPESLPIRVGRLIELRGKIQHHGVEQTDGLRQAYYEMELIVRTLIRHDAQIRGGWWPAPDNPSAFAHPYDQATAALQGRGSTAWHEHGLPAAQEPQWMGLPRRSVHPESDARVTLDPQLGTLVPWVAAVVVDAIDWCDPNASVSVQVGRPEEMTVAASADRVQIPSAWLPAGDGASELGRLAWDLYRLVGASIAQQHGALSEGPGIAVVEAFGCWCQYQRAVATGGLDASALNLPRMRGYFGIGKLAGWAAAGDARALAKIRRSWRWRSRRLALAIVRGLRDAGPPTSVLVLAQAAD